MDTITYVGLDVHKATIAVALAESGRAGKVRQLAASRSPFFLTRCGYGFALARPRAVMLRISASDQMNSASTIADTIELVPQASHQPLS
jgi:hypothetical protein